MNGYILALDQGTTSSRAIVFDHSGRVRGVGQHEFPQYFPQPGHVEHNPEEIWSSQQRATRDAIGAAKVSVDEIVVIGVTNQRETTVLWDRTTGKAIAPAIVWQSRITTDICQRLKSDGHETLFRQRTGLVLDPYFSGTKIRHLLDTVPGARTGAERGDVLFGTVDSFLLWRLSGGRLHITDPSNASRTLLFNIHSGEWDDELLRIMNVPRAMMPTVRPSSAVYGETDRALLGRAIPLAGDAGDQQAATFGQTCFQPGMAKNTYGTGCFMLMNTGAKPVPSTQGLLTTVAWQIGEQTTYALEGSVFIAGAAVQWLRDGLGIIQSAAETEALATSIPDNGDVYLVPAFTGLGAPFWDPHARGILTGITRGTTRAHLCRAALEAMAYQTQDVLEAMQVDSGQPLAALKVDGGATTNNWLMQFQADMLGVPVHRPVVQETTALGAAYLAGLAVGYWQDLSDLERNWQRDREFTPQMPPADRNRLTKRWRQAVERSRGWTA